MIDKNKIRVLECIRQGMVGGGESHLLSLIGNIDRSRFEPIVLSFTEGPMVDALRKANIECHVIHTEKPFDVTKWLAVKRFIKSVNIDIIHAHGTRVNSNVIWAARSLNIPVVYTVHGWSFHQDQSYLVRNLRIRGEKYLTAKSSINISVSASNKKSGAAVLKKFESVVIENGIDQTKFSLGRKHKNIREELGIARDTVLVLFVARFTLQKQPLLLLKAFATAIQNFPKLHLLMVGDGELKAEALELAQTLKLDGYVTFQPFRSDIPDILAAGDVFVLPSLWEGLPIALLEAMAMAKAVIATDVDGTNEVIENNRNGILIPAGSEQALSDALLVVAKNMSLRLMLQQNANTTVQKSYNAMEMTRRVEEVYLQLFFLQLKSQNISFERIAEIKSLKFTTDVLESSLPTSELKHFPNVSFEVKIAE